jgi:hypothetical protein
VRRRPFTRWDALVIAALLLLNGGLMRLGGSGERPAAAEILSDAGPMIVSLDGDRTLAVTGPLGTSRVRVSAEGIALVESPCPLQICVRSGPVVRVGQVVVCLPNRVAVRVLGQGDAAGGVDAVGQ